MTTLPDLDRRVAETVMGLAFCDSPMATELPHRCSRFEDPDHLASDERALPYSSDLETAWQVVARMRALGWVIELHNDDLGGDPGWAAGFSRPGCTPMRMALLSLAETAPEAICRAALDAIERAADASTPPTN